MIDACRKGSGLTQQPRQVRLTAETFVEWAMEQPSGRFELLDGEVVAMAPERAGHVRAKTDVLLAFHAALAAHGIECEAFADGMAVRIDESTVYEPDASIRCGPKLPNDAVLLDDPVVVVEVISPSSQSIDTGTKLAGCFRLASVRHYLVVHPEGRRVIHHGRSAQAGEIVTRVLGEDATLTLDPPGIGLAVADFFATL